MKAVVLREVGGDLALEDVARPDGEPSSTSGRRAINFADVLIRRGLYPQMPELPYVLGNEVAGDLDGRRVVALPARAPAAMPSASRSTRSGRSTCPTARRTRPVPRS